MRLEWVVFSLLVSRGVYSQVLTPPYFNIAEGRRITATATCGVDVVAPELYCKLVGANADRGNTAINVIQGQVCDYCDPNNPLLNHSPQHAIDGTERWWQSPPLSRGTKYNEVNVTIDLGQLFHVAYVFIRMANSPRPGVWVLERSRDNGQTYQPWQYFADTFSDCEQYFGSDSVKQITKDDDVICVTQFSRVVPLEGGEIVVSLLNNRPSANQFFNSTVLQEFTQATNIRLSFIRTKTLLGHLMSVVRQDPTVTRRYFYSIKDISIGGRCVCNGHADVCDITDPNDPYKLLCRCQHNTCGDRCERCCPGFVQKKWRPYTESYECEPCNCFSHSNECVYDEETDNARKSIDIYGKYEGGGTCQNCRHNTEGINCERCKPGFYRPFGKLLNATDVCSKCDCDKFFSTGNCAEGTGVCECRPEFNPPNCDSCSVGHYGYPDCKVCDCHRNGTRGPVCEVGGGQCPCKPNYSGKNCNKCAEGHYNFPECSRCDCHPDGSEGSTCDLETGQCKCTNNYGGRQCDECEHGYFNYPDCEFCNCDTSGTEKEICEKDSGKCICKLGYYGDRCDSSAPGFYGYPQVKPCNCSAVGSVSEICDSSGKCPCLASFSGRTCDRCSPGYYNFPSCFPCNCANPGSIGLSCDDNGVCQCQSSFDGTQCESCKEGFYNYPLCEDCNCNPAGVLQTFAGCGTLTTGELCECKEHVTGRICNECKPLYWNLQPYNPLGCQDCDCHSAGVISGVVSCKSSTGQCHCKDEVGTRQCKECREGAYNLQEKNLFGCTDCECNTGGSAHKNCDKKTGSCTCKPLVSGRQCDKPLATHYYPTLYQHKYEIEDGYTPNSARVRYGYDEELFPGYSWRGYGIFSQLQKEVDSDIYVDKPSLYRMVIRYVNKGEEPILGTIRMIPESARDIEQEYKARFDPTDEPSLMTVSGTVGDLPSPFVLNPGKWTVTIKMDKNMFMDYFVLLPSDYYEGSVLQEEVNNPCRVGDDGPCVQYEYPNLKEFDVARGEEGYVIQDDTQVPTNQFIDDEILHAVNTKNMAILNKDQPQLHLDIPIKNPGVHAIVVNYVTPSENMTGNAHVEVTSGGDVKKGLLHLYNCRYSFLCRGVVTDMKGRVGRYKLKSSPATLKIKIDPKDVVAVDSAWAVPKDQWNLNYVKPKASCVKKEGICQSGEYETPPSSIRVDFEKKMNDTDDSDAFEMTLLDDRNPIVDVMGEVPGPGLYKFIVHYYQPDFPDYDVNVLVQNGQMYEAKLPIKYCPKVGGCRSMVTHLDGNTNFDLNSNFVLSLKEIKDKSVWLDYVLVGKFNEMSNKVLSEKPLDKTGIFLDECGRDHFYMDNSTSDFCKKSVFSLTTDYNVGALRCNCDPRGSLSFECESFGGQCPCKENVIGRTCQRCRTGYFGFPLCHPCKCPSTALCNEVNGDCICPPRVTGEKCDQCVSETYGFDPIMGCESCGCDPKGSLASVCDLESGQCSCKPNVESRKCDRCSPAHWDFPHCQLCFCNLQGTTDDVCDQETSECLCKENVHGPLCDICKPGTFNLESENPDGCTRCFCFSKTDQCTAAQLGITSFVTKQHWSVAVFSQFSPVLTPAKDDALPELESDSESITVTLEEVSPEDKKVYFSAPSAYQGNRITSYGKHLVYTVYYEQQDEQEGSGRALSYPDVILVGNNITLLHFALKQPASGIQLTISLDLLESNFVLPSGVPATREHLMMLLWKLSGIYIKSQYWDKTKIARLTNATLEIATDKPSADLAGHSYVEKCQCPDNYMGLSCEECAPGYYRVQTGPHGGFCIPCQCNKHSNKCDPITGLCYECDHNTQGDHCQSCKAGYYGDATGGSPYDCLICACPHPTESNNFAESCVLQTTDNSVRFQIQCTCKEGYLGNRCDYCAPGYYGDPETTGDHCKPCNCSGNIDAKDPQACDRRSGECLVCLNESYGPACSRCKPGFYGDAVKEKNCQSCSCSECGTSECNHTAGECVCKDNVIGEKCDACAPNNWGFSRCQGCTPCNCGLASESEQCDDAAGQCRCKDGVTGLQCDRCAAGHWNYSADGCQFCNCNTEFSFGLGCNPKTGQCECLPGVIGEKCDACPYRWVVIPDVGCQECDSCIDDLLDTMDELEVFIKPVTKEFESVALSFFTNQKLININETMRELGPSVVTLETDQMDLSPLDDEVKNLDKLSKSLKRKSEILLEESNSTMIHCQEALDSTRKLDLGIRNNLTRSKKVVEEVKRLADGLETSSAPQIDLALSEGERILDEIGKRNFSMDKERMMEELQTVEALLEDSQKLNSEMSVQEKVVEAINGSLVRIRGKLQDLMNNSKLANQLNDNTKAILFEIRNMPTTQKMDDISSRRELSQKSLNDSDRALANATKHLQEITENFEAIEAGMTSLEPSQEELKALLEVQRQEIKEMNNPVDEARNHADKLESQMDNLKEVVQDTKQTSQNAINAAEAYTNIINATRESKEAGNSAMDAANRALENESYKTAAESAQKSKELRDVGEEVADRVQLRLTPQMDSAKLRVKELEELNEKNDKKLEDLKQDLSSLGGEKHAIEEWKEATEVISEAARNVDNVMKELSEKELSARQMAKENHDTIAAIEFSNDQLTQARKAVPEAEDLIERIKGRQEKLKQVGDELKDKIEALKKMIMQSRDQADRIQIGVQFYPNTTLEMRNPDSLEDSATSTSMSLYFHTSEPNGFLAYVGNEVDTHKRLLRTSTDDFMALEIDNGYVNLVMNLGTGTKRIKNDLYVPDGAWYLAKVDRTGKTVRLSVSTEGPNKSVIEKVSQDVLPGTFSVFNLNKDASKIYVGGIPPSANVQDDIKHKSFYGAIEGVELNGEPVGLWNFVHGESNSVGAIERNAMVDLQPVTGLRFDGNGYAVFPKHAYQFAKKLDIQLKFTTLQSNGLLFYAGKKDSFVSLEIVEGKLLYQFDLGDGPVRILSQDVYNDGIWHSISAVRFKKNGTLTVDNQRVGTGQSSGTNEKLSVAGSIYFGGLPSPLPHDMVTPHHFDGCIDGVQLTGTLVDLSQHSQALGVTPGCPLRVARIVSFDTNRGGYIGDIRAEGFSQLTLKFKTFAENGLLFLATDRDQDNFFILSLKDGTLRLQNSPNIQVATNPISKYNDGNWHYITATRYPTQIRLDIDDYETYSETMAPMRANTPPSSLIYLAGIPDDFQFHAEELEPPFNGCLGDVTLNGEFLNFAGTHELVRAQIDTCEFTKESETGRKTGKPTPGHKHPDKGRPDGKKTESGGGRPDGEKTGSGSRRPDGEKTGSGGRRPDGEKTGSGGGRPDSKKPDSGRGRPDYETGDPDYDIRGPDHETKDPDYGPLYPEYGTEDQDLETGPSGPTEKRPDNERDPDGYKDPDTTDEEYGEEGDYEEYDDLSEGRRPDSKQTTPSPTTPPTTTLAPTCVLPPYPAEDAQADPRNGWRFGNKADSRVEFFDQTVKSFAKELSFRVQIKSDAPDGIIFHIPSDDNVDYVSLYMKDGQITFSFNCGSGPSVIKSQKDTYGDGQWHDVAIEIQTKKGKLQIDDQADVATGISPGQMDSLNLGRTSFLGGVRASIDRRRYFEGIGNGFVGCLREPHFGVRRLIFDQNNMFDVTPCSPNVELGTFFAPTGGYVVAHDRFRVGLNIDIYLEVKPRNTSGILLAVHGRKDFMLLQLKEGSIVFSVDNGRGPITASFDPSFRHYLCDGGWHTIQALKTKNVVTLSVDNVYVEPGIGPAGVSATDTNTPLYVGGHPEPNKVTGLQDHHQYVGCIRNLSINDQAISLGQAVAHGDVLANTCPTI